LDIESAFDIYVTVHDELGQLRGRENRNPLPGRHLHSHPYCRYLRDKREGELLCTRNCVSRINGIFNSGTGRSDCVESCWKGITEVVVTIRQDGLRLLTLFAGTFRRDGVSCPLEQDATAKRYYDALPVLTDSKRNQISRMLYVLGFALLAFLEQELKAEIPPSSSSRKRQIWQFIWRNAHRPKCDLKELARELHLSVSRTGHAVIEECGDKFLVLLNRERIQRAKRLLLTSDLKLEQIAERTGFSSNCYFSRVFRHFEQLAPGQYRSQSWKKIPNC
jgi:AraC-like DNA-binding protein